MEYKRKKGKIAEITIDEEKCIGCGSCTVITPKVFKLNKEGKSSVVNPDASDDESIISAAQVCPVEAIKLFDAKGKEIKE